MKDWKPLEEIVNSILRRYEETFNQVNTENEVRFVTTLDNMQVEVQGVKKWVAYLRLQRDIRPKGGTDNDWESILIYNQAYKFEGIQERLNPNTPWKYDLYDDMLYRLAAGGLEYSELMKRLKNTAQQNAGKPVGEIANPKLDLEITDKMPDPLNKDEQEYLHWVKQNSEKA